MAARGPGNYWHEKARAMVKEGRAKRVGLLATQGIRSGANRRILERVKTSGDIFFARSSDVWVVEGAAVNVSLVGFDDGSETDRRLDGKPVTVIDANLTSGLDVTAVVALPDNRGLAFMGDTKGGHFDIAPDVAMRLLARPNPDGRSNAEVVRPWANSLDITRRPRNLYIIDFGSDMLIEEAALYEGPFEYVKEQVRPRRLENSHPEYSRLWWLHTRPRPAMRTALSGLARFIATPTVSKHRLFVWLDPATLPDHQLIVFPATTTTSSASSTHASMNSGRGGSALSTSKERGTRRRRPSKRSPSRFPEPAHKQRDAVAQAAQKLDKLRRGWLLPEGHSEDELRKRTLTNLYNHPPSWLTHAHNALDHAVHAAYGWTYPLEDANVLERLVALNLHRAAPASAEAA